MGEEEVRELQEAREETRIQHHAGLEGLGEVKEEAEDKAKGGRA